MLGWEVAVGELIQRGVISPDSTDFYWQAINNERSSNPKCPFADTIEVMLTKLAGAPSEQVLDLLSEINWRIAGSGGEVRSDE